MNHDLSPVRPFVARTSAAKMPGTCRFGHYRHVAVIETDGTEYPAMISARARGVRQIVKTWRRLHAGRTSGMAWHGNTAFVRAYREACEMADILNEECCGYGQGY